LYKSHVRFYIIENVLVFVIDLNFSFVMLSYRHMYLETISFLIFTIIPVTCINHVLDFILLKTSRFCHRLEISFCYGIISTHVPWDNLLQWCILFDPYFQINWLKLLSCYEL